MVDRIISQIQPQSTQPQPIDTTKFLLLFGLLFALFVGVMATIYALQALNPKQMLCKDGKTIVTNEADCPTVDEKLKKCEDMPADYSSSYYYEYSSSLKDKCFFYLALERQNISICSKIIAASSYSDYTTGKCGAMIAEKQGKPEVCDQLGATSDISDCYSAYAYKTESYAICDNIQSNQERDDCLKQFISYSYYGSVDWSICTKFSSTSSADSCYYEAAYGTGDVSYCDNIKSKSGWYTKPICYAAAARNAEDPSYCALLTTALDKDKCYKEYATSSYDVSVCDYINNSGIKSSCIKSANYTSYWN